MAPQGYKGKVVPYSADMAAAEQTWGQRFDNWMVNEGYKVIFFSVWVIAQILMFALAFVNFKFSDNQVTMNSVLLDTYPTARGAALVIHVNTGIILLPVCRTLITILRNTPLNRVIPFDKNLTFHKAIGWSSLFFSCLHTVAHYVNFYRLSVLPGFENWLFYSFVSGPGWTGHIMLVALFAICLTAAENARRSNFERFWYTHHLFLVYLGLFTIHGAFCLTKADRKPVCGNIASFWKYWIAGGVCYMCERIAREVRGRHRTYVSKVVLHPSKVVELQIKKDRTVQRPGQYIFLCCPAVSLWQYHPFTLTSCPEEEFISVHIRCVGDWTRGLAKVLGCDVDSKTPKSTDPANGMTKVLPRVMVDGPFGAASEDVFNFEVVMLFGAGIGVTPFAAILKSIWYRVNYPKKPTRLRKVYFNWICRDKEAFEWFQDVIKAIEDEDIDQMIEINTYLTKGLKDDEIKNIQINDEAGRRDAITGLRSGTHFGRPNLDQVFKGMTKKHPATDIGVFFCGPKVLSGQLHVMCNKYNQPQEDGTKFFYNKENF